MFVQKRVSVVSFSPLGSRISSEQGIIVLSFPFVTSAAAAAPAAPAAAVVVVVVEVTVEAAVLAATVATAVQLW